MDATAYRDAVHAGLRVAPLAPPYFKFLDGPALPPNGVGGVGLAHEFVTRYVESIIQPGRSVFLVPAAVGSMPLDKWMPGNVFFERMMAGVNASLNFSRQDVSGAGELVYPPANPPATASSTRGASPSSAPQINRVVALLWHHGESSLGVDNYFDLLARIVKEMRARIAAMVADLKAAAAAAGAPMRDDFLPLPVPVVMGQIEASKRPAERGGLEGPVEHAAAVAARDTAR